MVFLIKKKTFSSIFSPKNLILRAKKNRIFRKFRWFLSKNGEKPQNFYWKHDFWPKNRQFQRFFPEKSAKISEKAQISSEKIDFYIKKTLFFPDFELKNRLNCVKIAQKSHFSTEKIDFYIKKPPIFQ